MKIKIYGADWCADCVNLKKFLISKGIDFEYILITDNQHAIDFVKKKCKGKTIIPTLEIDGKIYINPGIYALMKIIKE